MFTPSDIFTTLAKNVVFIEFFLAS